MLNLNSLLIGTDNIERLSAFYEDLFERKADMEEDGYFGWQVGECFFTVGKHSDVSGQAKNPQRIILNFETREVDEEFERIKDIDGVTVIKEPYEMEGGLIATLADPDGNYFQLITPWKVN